ncbi:coiled coil domain-containing protein [uncultured Amphritea sp.]|uniref:coiled coil domain-containing protein n=1 Tax=uncultured Amphritea sp. TaxID=981605 RepID=UPI00263515C6|nr:coiled coil domain-containing protein [uncultured Amphritea sp.]
MDKANYAALAADDKSHKAIPLTIILNINQYQKWGKVMSKKELYQQKLQAHLDEMSADINKLKAKADNAGADVQLEYYKQLEELKTMQASARNKLDELKNAGDDAWEDLKTGMDSAWGSISTALKSASSRFK